MSLSRMGKDVISPFGCSIVGSICNRNVRNSADGTDAFDVIGELTYSKPLGFLEQGRDVDGIIASLEKILDYAGKVRTAMLFFETI